MDYATVADLRQYLDTLPTQEGQIVQSTKTEEEKADLAVAAWLGRATDIIRQYMQFSFDAYGAATVKSIRTSNTQFLFLPPHELGSVTSVAVGDTVIDSTAYTTNSSQDGHREWLVMLEGGGVLNTWRNGYGRVNVTAKWGYGLPPPSIVEVCIELAVNIYRGAQRGLFSDVVGLEGEGGVAYSRQMTASMRAILDNVAVSYAQVVV